LSAAIMIIKNSFCAIDCRSLGFLHKNSHCVHYLVQSTEYNWR
jgi:hypothetical protein